MTLLKGENKNKFCGLKLIPEHLGEQNSLCLGSASTFYYNVAPAPPLTCSDCPKINIPTSVAHLLQQMNPADRSRPPEVCSSHRSSYSVCARFEGWFELTLAASYSMFSLLWQTPLPLSSSSAHPKTPVKIIFLVLFSSVFIDKKI